LVGKQFILNYEEYHSNGVSIKIKRISEPPFLYNKDFTVSQDGKRFAYTSCKYSFFCSGKFCAVIDGKTMQVHKGDIRHYLLLGGTTWPYISLAFSSDSKHVKYNDGDTVFIDGKPSFHPNCDHLVDLMFLPENNILYYFVLNGQYFLQLNDGAFIPYDNKNWYQTIAVSNTIDSVATMQLKKDPNISGNQITRDGKMIDGITDDNWPFVFENNAEPVYVFLDARSLTRSGKHIYSPCLPVYKNNPNKKNMVNYYPDVQFLHLRHQKTVPLNENIPKEFRYTIDNCNMAVYFSGKLLNNFSIDGYPIANGLELNPNHLVLFGKRWGVLFRIDVLVENP
jgi:hypothetical protein